MKRGVLHADFRVCDGFGWEGGKGEINNGIFPMEDTSTRHDMLFNSVESIMETWNQEGIAKADMCWLAQGKCDGTNTNGGEFGSALPQDDVMWVTRW